MSSKSPRLLSMVLVPAIITLIVCVVRLMGELNEWDVSLFGREAGGSTDPDKPNPSLFGIGMLIPIFGFWFGFKLRRATGEPPKLGKTLLLLLAALAVPVLGGLIFHSMELLSFPNPESPGEPKGLEYLLGLLAVSLVLIFIAWPKQAMTLLVYGFLARIPVVVITIIAIDKPDWDTHYTKLPAGAVLPEGASKLTFLLMPQMTVWIVFTMLVGGLFGCLGAALGKKKD